jgi:hypothetical protein
MGCNKHGCVFLTSGLLFLFVMFACNATKPLATVRVLRDGRKVPLFLVRHAEKDRTVRTLGVWYRSELDVLAPGDSRAVEQEATEVFMDFLHSSELVGISDVSVVACKNLDRGPSRIFQFVQDSRGGWSRTTGFRWERPMSIPPAGPRD